MTERELAINVAQCHARYVCDKYHLVTMGGAYFGEKYAEMLYKDGSLDPVEIGKIKMACRHWIDAVGYNEIGKFQIVVASSIRNC